MQVFTSIEKNTGTIRMLTFANKILGVFLVALYDSEFSLNQIIKYIFTDISPLIAILKYKSNKKIVLNNKFCGEN